MTDEQYEAMMKKLDRILTILDASPRKRKGMRIVKRSSEPQPGASLDTWLDWRDSERKWGRKGGDTALASIALASGYPLSTIKKKSAERSAQRRRKV